MSQVRPAHSRQCELVLIRHETVKEIEFHDVCKRLLACDHSVQQPHSDIGCEVTSSAFGKVLQVVNTTSTTQRTTNSTSFSDSGLAVSITPSATSSKILIIFSSSGYADTTGQSSIYTLYRDSTNLGDSTYGNIKFTNGGSNLEYGMNFQVYDSPSTTSAISYKVYQRATGGNAISYISRNSIPSYLTAMEVAG